MEKLAAQKVTIERVIKILTTENLKISREEAANILKFIDTITEIAVDQYLRKK